jgi:hypothetical protein
MAPFDGDGTNHCRLMRLCPAQGRQSSHDQYMSMISSSLATTLKNLRTSRDNLTRNSSAQMRGQSGISSVSMFTKTDQIGNSMSPRNTTSRPYWRSTTCQTAIQHVHPFPVDSGQSWRQMRSLRKQKTSPILKSQEPSSMLPQFPGQTFLMQLQCSAGLFPSGASPTGEQQNTYSGTFEEQVI